MKERAAFIGETIFIPVGVKERRCGQIIETSLFAELYTSSRDS
jgi:hypothetical protein